GRRAATRPVGALGCRAASGGCDGGYAGDAGASIGGARYAGGAGGRARATTCSARAGRARTGCTPARESEGIVAADAREAIGSEGVASAGDRVESAGGCAGCRKRGGRAGGARVSAADRRGRLDARRS